MQIKEFKIGVIGLGYVGLPLAVEFSKKYFTVGYDINENRIAELMQGRDSTLEVSDDEIKKTGVIFTTDKDELKNANVFIVTVPTPVDKYNNPDLSPVEKASYEVASVLKEGDIVVYESTVYPGVTEDICVPILEKVSKLKLNIDFYCGYSPERINPGDKMHTLTKIQKITSGSNEYAAGVVNQLYASIITAGTFQASSIRVAEAAKVIENAQRDINIAFVNELAKIFNLLNIDTNEVLKAASTKWNFINFKPGLVGGHCIGVDPFYLAHKAKEVGYHPEIILAGRRVNDSMGGYVANQFIKLLIKSDIKVKGAEVLVLGISFKENCPDIRNSKVIDIITELRQYETKVSVYDPWVDNEQVLKECKIQMTDHIDDIGRYSGIIVAVGHEQFKKIVLPANIVCYDVKGIFNRNEISGNL